MRGCFAMPLYLGAIFGALVVDAWHQTDCNAVANGPGVEMESGECCASGVIDDCGVCDGGNASCADCNAVANGPGVEMESGECCASGVVDYCGVCDGSNECADCNAVANGPGVEMESGACCASGVIDDCGVCDGGNASCNPDDQTPAPVPLNPVSAPVPPPTSELDVQDHLRRFYHKGRGAIHCRTKIAGGYDCLWENALAANGCDATCKGGWNQCCFTTIYEAISKCSSEDECRGFWRDGNGVYWLRGYGVNGQSIDGDIDNNWTSANYWLKHVETQK